MGRCLLSTFEKVTETAIPPSHALVFVYGSISQVKKMLRSGIIVDDESGGIVVSLHQPHELTDAEDAYFPRREAFVACSVLKESLEPLPAGDDESPLRILPAAVLTAMRGTYFGDVVDPSPWLEGKILLPPQMCLRAYQLEEYAIDDDDSDPTGGPFGDVELANPFKRKTVGKPDDPLQLLQVVPKQHKKRRKQSSNKSISQRDCKAQTQRKQPLRRKLKKRQSQKMYLKKIFKKLHKK